jgi:uncharacterized protein
MKKKLFTVAILLTAAILLAGCGSLAPAAAEQTNHTIDVSGRGTVDLSPDIARVNIGVRSQSPDVGQALEENTANAEAIIKRLIDLGVDQNDIQTRNFNVYPQQNREPGPESEMTESQTFMVENTVSVTVRDLDSLGEILSAMIREGANTIHGVTFDVEDREAAIAEARSLAIEDAKTQAETLAEAAGVSLGEIHSIRINESGSEPVERAVQMEEAAGGGDVPISGGQLTIRVTANLTYGIE